MPHKITSLNGQEREGYLAVDETGDFLHLYRTIEEARSEELHYSRMLSGAPAPIVADLKDTRVAYLAERLLLKMDGERVYRYPAQSAGDCVRAARALYQILDRDPGTTAQDEELGALKSRLAAAETALRRERERHEKLLALAARAHGLKQAPYAGEHILHAEIVRDLADEHFRLHSIRQEPSDA